MDLNIRDVRAEMPNYGNYRDWRRSGPVLGIAIHHSATADHVTGAPTGDAYTYFNYHVNVQGWSHGGYHYVITGRGEVQYALDEQIPAYHAGFKDPSDSLGLEQGQYWNNHYLAVCLSGWFSENRTYRDASGYIHPIPNNHTAPGEAQMTALLALLQKLRQKYDLPVENVRGHRELTGTTTACPGSKLDPAEIRQKLWEMEEARPEPLPPEPDQQPEVAPGEHVVLLPDTDKYFEAAMAYIWKFQPDVSFAAAEARGRWKFVTAVGNPENISDNLLSQLRTGGAVLVQRIAGEPLAVQAALDQLVEDNVRFLTQAPVPEPPAGEWRSYTIQPGDTLSLIAKQMYGAASLWRIIFEANQNILSDPGQIRPGQVLKIPPKPA